MLYEKWTKESEEYFKSDIKRKKYMWQSSFSYLASFFWTLFGVFSTFSQFFFSFTSPSIVTKAITGYSQNLKHLSLNLGLLLHGLKSSIWKIKRQNYCNKIFKNIFMVSGRKGFLKTKAEFIEKKTDITMFKFCAWKLKAQREREHICNAYN